jgi:membrane-associated protein
MELIHFVLHFEEHLRTFIADYGTWIYVLLFLIIFCETGLVVMPFLPGDSLLFAVGALAAQGLMDPFLLYFLLITAAILGDSVNYSIGAWFGPQVFHQENSRWFNRKHLDRTHAFYEKYGSKAIVLARFVPIVRTFAPFVAGIGRMTYTRFFFYNVIGGFVWITLFLWAGYLLGNIPFVKQNFKYLILLIIVVSILPIVWEWWQAKKHSSSEDKKSA